VANRVSGGKSDKGARGAKTGRPRALEADDKTLAQIRALSQIDATEEEMAAVLGVATSTFREFKKREPAGAMAAGLAPKDLLAIGAAMTEVGLASGRAGTAVNAMLTKMTDLGNKKKASKVIDQLGGKGYSKKLQKEFFENPTQALVKILRLTEKMSRPDRATFMKDLFGLETQDEVAALAGNVDRVVDTLDKLGSKSAQYAGSVDRVFESFKNTTKNQWAQFTNNVELASAALGAKLLPAINGSLHYLNNFFATAEGRVSIFDRLSASANGFFNGLGYKGGSAEFLSGVASSLKDIRDLIFGIEGDGMSGEKMAELFHRWQQFGASLHDSPIKTILDAISNAKLSDLGGSVLAASVGMGALSFAAKIALSPLNAIWAVLKGITATAYTLSGLRLGKWLFDLIKGAGGGAVAGSEAAGTAGGALGWGLLARFAPWLARVGLPAGAALTLFKALEAKGPADARLFDPSQNANVVNESRARTGNPINGQTEPTPPATASQPAEPFSFGGLWRDLMQPIGPNASAGPQPVDVSGPVTTVPSGVQRVEVTNPAPAPVINVTVHATTNASPAEIGSAVARSVSGALRQNLSDGGY
jgi:hypothetical protein